MIHNGFDPRLAAVLKVCQICPPACLLSDPYVARPQTIFLKQKIFPHATYQDKFRMISVCRLVAVILCKWLADPGEAVTSMIPNNSDTVNLEQRGYCLFITKSDTSAERRIHVLDDVEC